MIFDDLLLWFTASEGHQSLSEDQNAIKLGRVIKPEIVIGIKALQCIFASQLSGDTDWIIPFTGQCFSECVNSTFRHKGGLISNNVSILPKNVPNHYPEQAKD